MTASNDNLINWKICSHIPAMFTSKKLTAYKILQCLYVDDGVFPFGRRECSTCTIYSHIASRDIAEDWEF
jgi:hypothetical protein